MRVSPWRLPMWERIDKAARDVGRLAQLTCDSRRARYKSKVEASEPQVIPIELSSGYSIVARRRSLPERLLTLDQVLAVMETTRAYSENDDLLVFGPAFGLEALNEFMNRLTRLGLIYWDDFFEFKEDLPPWCGIRAELRS